MTSAANQGLGSLARLFLLALALFAAYFVLRPAPPVVSPAPEPPASTPATPSDHAGRNAGSVESDEPRPPGPTGGAALPAPGEAPAEQSVPLDFSSSRVNNVNVRDRDGKTVFHGTVDLRQTLARIRQGELLRFPDDGITFANRERRLPAKPPGYYHEYVHPTPRTHGPGPQRIVVGAGGEVYYTPDHYRTFQRL